jgi:hypothetical protein
MCPACENITKKEKEAKAAEDKRRFDILVAKEKAEKDAFEKERLEKIAEDKKTAEAGKVYISVNTTITNSVVNNAKKKEALKLEKNYFYSVGGNDNQGLVESYEFHKFNGFVVNGDTIFNNHEFKNCIGVMTYPEINKFNFPPNIGIVKLNEEKTIPFTNSSGTHYNKYPISDLVDISGKRILNDDNISYILHLVDDYFVLLKGMTSLVGNKNAFDGVDIYNLKTGISYPVQKGYATHNRGIYHRVLISSHLNEVYPHRKEDLKPKGSYKAFFVTEVWSKQYIFYYINNNGEIERQEVNL